MHAMRQLLLLILLFFVGSWFSRKVREAQSRHASGTPRRDDAASPAAGSGAARSGALIEPMVRCEACGIHVPKGDAIAGGGRYYCCAEHAAHTPEREGA
jgi:uncharacterized protein